MDGNDGLCGGPASLELSFHSMFCNIARDYSCVLEDSVAVDFRYHGVQIQVAVFREEVKDNHIPWFGSVSRSKASSLYNYCHDWHSHILQNGKHDID